jgi:putative hemolysin
LRQTLVAIVLFAMSACTPDPVAPTAVGLANPASVYCAELGGTSTSRTTPEGKVADCHLPDGRVIEEWALFRQDHP